MQRFFFNKTYVLPLLFVLLPLLAMTPWKKNDLCGYFPLSEEIVWQYNVFDHKAYELTIHDSISCKGDTMINGKRYVSIAGRKNERVFPAGYWRFEETALYRYHTIKKHDVLFADFSNGQGERSVSASDSLVYATRVLSTDTTYKIPGHRKISWSDDEPMETKEPKQYTDVYCVEWTEKKNADTAILFFQHGTGLVGLKMEGGLELYLNTYTKQRK